MSDKICTVGLISWCDPKKFPKRFRVFKECVSSFQKYLPRDRCRFVLVDNNSPKEVADYIKSLRFFDKRIILPKNIHDIGAYAVLAKVCSDFKTEFFLPTENDYVFFRKNFLVEACDFLKRTPNCGYVRLLKFEYEKKDTYDKVLNTKKGLYNPNAVRMYNLITKKKIFWAGPVIDDSGNSFYINNWHWMTFGSLTTITLWDKIFPKFTEGSKVPAYQFAELSMIKKYNDLGFQTLVLDGGAFSHQDPISMYQTSYKRRIPVVASEVNYFVRNWERFVV